MKTSGRTFEDLVADVGKRPRLWLGVLTAVVLVQAQPWWWLPGRDGLSYMSMARGLAQRGEWANLGAERLTYPIGYPTLASPAFLLSDRPFLMISLLHVGLMLAAMLCAYAWARRYLARPAALGVTAMVVVNAVVWAHVRETLSETAFIAVLMASLLVLTALREARGAGRVIGWTLLGVAGVAALCSIRYAGACLAAGFGMAVLADAWLGRVTWARALATGSIISAAALGTAVGLMVWDQSHAAPNAEITYIEVLVPEDISTWAWLLGGLHSGFNAAGQLLVPGLFKTYADRNDWLSPILLLYIPLWIVLAVGWLRFFRRTGDVLAWMMPFYIGLYLVWPFSQGPRFYLPLLPMLAMALWMCVEPWPRHRMSIVALFVLAHLAAAVGRTANHLPRAAALEARWEPLEALTEPVRAEPGWAAAVALDQHVPEMISFLIDRPIARPPDLAGVDERVRWVFVREDAPRPDGYEPIGAADGILLLRRP